MSLATISISKSPTTGLNRSLDVVGLIININTITLQQIIYSLDSSGNRINSMELPAYSKDSVATDGTLVDPATGLYVISNGSGGYIYDGGTQNGNAFTGTPVGEYSFLIAMLGTSVNITNMFTQYVQLNDSLGDYN